MTRHESLAARIRALEAEVHGVSLREAIGAWHATGTLPRSERAIREILRIDAFVSAARLAQVGEGIVDADGAVVPADDEFHKWLAAAERTVELYSVATEERDSPDRQAARRELGEMQRSRLGSDDADDEVAP